MKKEAITHGVLEDLANRNDNWDKLDGVINQVNELDESRLILKNEIANGDFSDGTVGWRVSGVLTVIEDVAKIVPTSQYSELSQSYALTLLDKYYACATVKNSSNTRIALSIYGINGSGGGGYIIEATTESVKTFLSGVFTVNSIGSSGTSWMVKKTIANDISEFEVFGNNHLINLTQTFGAGNEPTKEEMDIIMDTIGYFNGEHTITSKEQFNILLKMVRENALATTSLGGGF